MKLYLEKGIWIFQENVSKELNELWVLFAWKRKWECREGKEVEMKKNDWSIKVGERKEKTVTFVTEMEEEEEG